MLIYHPAFDTSHCAYRILKIFNTIDSISHLEADRLKIIDFYLVFPKQIKNIRFPRAVKTGKIRSAINSIDDTYRPCKSPFLIFQKMNIIQEKVLKSLVMNEYLDYSFSNKSYKQGAKFKLLSLSEPLFDNFFPFEVEKEIINFFTTYEVDGKDGLKDRTQMLEFRYDK